MDTTDKLPTMKTRGKQVTAGGIAVGAVAAVIASVYAFGAVNAAQEPVDVVRPASVVVEPTIDPITPEDEVIAEEAREAARIAAEQEAARLAAEKAAAEAAAAEAARIAAEQQAAEDAQQNSGGGGSGGGGGSAPAEPSGPIRCPAGSSANASDGVNDLSCFPDICFTITVPDPSHPECDVAFRP